MKNAIHNLSIRQNILLATLGTVILSLLVTSLIYYTSFSKATDSLVEKQSREINKQIVLNYESYINNVIETANYIQEASLNLDAADSLDELQNIYRVNTEIKKDVVSIFLFNESGELLLGNKSVLNTDMKISEESWFRNALQEKDIFHFSAPSPESVSAGQSEQVISVSKSVEYTNSGEKRKGIILLELNFRTITDLADKTNLGEFGHILILDDNDSLIYNSDTGSDNASEESTKAAVSSFFGGFKTVINSRKMFMNINTLSHTRWRIVTVNNVDDLSQANKRMLVILLVIFMSSSAVIAMLAGIISIRISKPLSQLKKSMVKIENGDFYTKVNVSGQKEIVLLSATFNNMIDKIRSLMEKVVTEQKEKRKTELVALQNQINPHFLYNTLDSIVWLSENDRIDEVITTVIALARFFRISISKGENFIPVLAEIEHIRNYLTIQKIRYVDKFEYLFDVDDSILDLKVMKLILQPIVENAIYHGTGDEKGIITIRGYRNKGFLYFEIENTGYGLTEENIREMYSIMQGNHKERSVGIRNVYQRLKLYYGEKADIVITSELDFMTNVKLVIPLDAVKEKGKRREK